MKPEERKWIAGYAALLIALTTLPYLNAFSAQGENWRFTGFLFGVQDGNSYIAKMLLGASGDWLFRTPYTASPQRGVLAFLPYLLLGKLAAPPAIHTQLVALFHLFRVAVIPFAVWATYAFAGIFFEGRRWRRWVTVLGTAGGGLGWLAVITKLNGMPGGMPLDFISPESFGFLAMLGLPHLILGRGLLLRSLHQFLLLREQPSRAWRAGLNLLLLGLVQPIGWVPAAAVIAGTLFLRLIQAGSRAWRDTFKQLLLPAAKMALIPLPLMLYLVLSYSRDPFFAKWTVQNRILSPPPAAYGIAYGLMLIPAAFGLWRVVGGRRERGQLLVVWMIVLPGLIYAPHNLQRRFAEGAWPAMLILAAIGLQHWSRAAAARAVSWGLAALSLPTTAMLLIGAAKAASRPAEPIFREAGEVRSFQWLAEHAQKADVVLASFETGNALPAWAPVRVVIGHGPESVDLGRLEPEVLSFFQEDARESEREALLRANDVRYVFYGPREKALGRWDPGESPLLQVVYERDSYRILEVLP